MNKGYNEGTPYARKLARTVWGGGKAGDNIKGLPIAITSDANRTKISRLHDGASG